MIPSLIHFIWIQVNKPFSRQEYLCLKSAIKNTPYQVHLHTNLRPGQAEQYCPYALVGDRLTIHQEDYVCEYKGIQVRPATLSDILRIKILQEYGGVYSDLDMLWFKPLPIPMDQYSLVSTWQNPSYKIVANYVLASVKGYNWTPLLEEFDKIFDDLIKKKKDSVAGESLKEHLTLFKATGDFLKKHSDIIIRKIYFGRNTWKNIWRFLTDQVPESKITLEDICGIHICGCGLFGEYKVDTTLLLTKHSKLKAFCDALEAA
jgi:hypothetical protein